VVLSFVVLSFSFFRLCNILPKSTFSFSFFYFFQYLYEYVEIVHRFLVNCRGRGGGLGRYFFGEACPGGIHVGGGGIAARLVGDSVYCPGFFLPVSALARNFVLVIFPLRPTWLCLESFSVRRRPRIVRCLPGVLDRNYCNGSFFGRPHFLFSGCIRSLGGFWRISGIGWLRSSLKLV
jgi:hypothetical protein